MDISYSVEEFLIWCEAERGYSANTVKSYKSDLNKLISYFKNDLDEINEKSLLKFIKKEFNFNLLSTKSQARLITTLKVFFHFLEGNSDYKFNFIELIESPKVQKSLPKAISYEEIEKLLNAYPMTDEFLARNNLILEVMYSCALRISECVGLNVQDINFEKENILVFGKGGKERIVPIGGVGLSKLRKYLDLYTPSMLGKTKTNALFLNQHGKRLTRQSLWDIVKKAAKLAGIKTNVSPHTLRHSCATHMIEHGANIRIVQEFLGHVSLTTTQIYTQVSSDLLHKQLAKSHPRY